jgi:carbonic anhydrase
VVLGHEDCSAVKATVDGEEAPGSIKCIIEKIKPAYEKVKNLSANKEDLYEKTIDENIKNSLSAIMKSPIIQKLEAEKKVEVIAAKYHMETGEVTFAEQ